MDTLGSPLDLVFGEPSSIFCWRQSQPPKWLVEGLLARSSVTILSAKGGCGKSMLTTDLAIHLASGDSGDWLDAFKLTEGPHRIGIIDAENGKNRTLRRIQELVIGNAFPPELADCAEPNLKLFPAESLQNRGEIIANLPNLITHHALDIVILDPLRCFLPTSVDDENNNMANGRVIDDLVAIAKRSLVSILVLDHDGKAGGAARGAQSKQDSAEFVWHLTQPDSDNPHYLELNTLKQRDPGGPTKLAITRICGTPTETNLRPLRFERTDLLDPDARAIATGNLDQRLLSLVSAHYQKNNSGISIRLAAEQLQVSKDKVHRRAKYLSSSNQLIRTDRDGLYPIEAGTDR